jgi:hypothetical protein
VVLHAHLVSVSTLPRTIALCILAAVIVVLVLIVVLRSLKRSA